MGQLFGAAWTEASLGLNAPVKCEKWGSQIQACSSIALSVLVLWFCFSSVSLSSTCCWSWAFPQSCTWAACNALQPPDQRELPFKHCLLVQYQPQNTWRRARRGGISVPPSRTHCRMFALVVQHSHFFLSLNLFAHFIWMKDSQGLKLLLPDSSILHYIIRYK